MTGYAIWVNRDVRLSSTCTFLNPEEYTTDELLEAYFSEIGEWFDEEEIFLDEKEARKRFDEICRGCRSLWVDDDEFEWLCISVDVVQMQKVRVEWADDNKTRLEIVDGIGGSEYYIAPVQKEASKK